MKFVLATVATLAATSASAADLGMGLTAGGEAVAEYNVDAENMLVTLEPKNGYTNSPEDVYLKASCQIIIYNDEFVLVDTLPRLDFEARKELWNGLDIYGGVSYDLDVEARGDMTVGVSFNF